MFTVAVIYAINFFWAKEVFQEIHPLAMVGIRIFVAALVFGIVARMQGPEKIRSRADFIRLFLCGFFGASLNMTMFFIGLDLTVPVNAAVLMTTSPLFVFILASLLKTERLNLRKVLGLLIAFSGAVWLSLGGREFSFQQSTIQGDLLILGNAAAYGIYLVLVRPLMLRYRLMTIVAWVFLFGALLNVPLSLFYLGEVNWGELSNSAAWGAFYIVAFVTLASYSLNGWALKYVSSSSVGVYIYLQPVLVGLLSFVWVGETLTLRQAGLMGMVLSGVYLVTYRKKRGETTGSEGH